MAGESLMGGGGWVGEFLRQLNASLRRLATGRGLNRCPRCDGWRPAVD